MALREVAEETNKIPFPEYEPESNEQGIYTNFGSASSEFGPKIQPKKGSSSGRPLDLHEQHL